MKSKKFFMMCLLLAVASYASAETVPADTSIAGQVQALFKAFEGSEEAKKLSKEDWATFEKDKQDLAMKMPDPGLHVGDKAPDFVLNNAFGKPVKLSSLYAQGPVILVFYRGGWCAICNIQLHSLNASIPEFKKHNAQLLAVTPQKPNKSKEQIKKDGYPFEIVSDTDYAVLKSYKLYFEISKQLSDLYLDKFAIDIVDYNGKGRYGLPVPATYIIDKKGIIRVAYAKTDYTQRMEPKDIVSALERL